MGSAGLGGGVSGTGAGVCSGGGSTVHIHPQAAPVVCRHVLDTLIQLAKVSVCFFLIYFILYIQHNFIFFLFPFF